MGLFPGAKCGKGGREVKMGEGYFIDQYNQEFSRDIEPMKGGHTDNYYYQLIANVRKYKGVAKPEPAGEPVTIDLNGGFDQWRQVKRLITIMRAIRITATVRVISPPGRM